MDLKKGQVVEVKQVSYGFTEYKTNNRVLATRKLRKPIKGIVVGYSFIKTGHVVSSTPGYDGDQGYLENIVNNKVWLIEPLTHENRYIKPIRALEADIEIVGGDEEIQLNQLLAKRLGKLSDKIQEDKNCNSINDIPMDWVVWKNIMKEIDYIKVVLEMRGCYDKRS